MTDDERRIAALRATAHPVRLRMLSLLTGTAMSAAEVARELGLTHANASYHLRVLRDVDELVEAGEERIRGGVAKRYRYPHERASTDVSQATDGGSRATPDERVAYVRAVAVEVERRVRQHTGRGIHSDLEGWVDPGTYERARQLLLEASVLLHEANRPPRTPGTVHVSQTTWTFAMADPDPDHETDPETDPEHERGDDT